MNGNAPPGTMVYTVNLPGVGGAPSQPPPSRRRRRRNRNKNKKKEKEKPKSPWTKWEVWVILTATSLVTMPLMSWAQGRLLLFGLSIMQMALQDITTGIQALPK